jgi:CheY-like chemotaxis protein
MMKPMAENKSIAFKILESQDLPAQIRSDSTRLNQCLLNLINNAIKFTDQGHVHLNVSLESRHPETFIRFDIEDTGIGIPQDKHEAIFDVFTQADASTTRKYGGSGLGLAVTRQLAGLLGGEVTLASQVGKGTTFSLLIPAGLDVTQQPLLNRYHHAESMEHADVQSDQVKFSGRCLVAEDVLMNQVLIRRLLENAGTEVTIVSNGQEAVQQAQNQTFDLILMDMQMPIMNGYDATREIRNLKSDIRNVPIIALTANAMKGDDRKCVDAGCNDYLSKPIDCRKLHDMLGKYLSSASSESVSTSARMEAMTREVAELGQAMRVASWSEDAPVVDWAELAGRGMGEDILREVIPLFISDKKEQLEKLADAMQTGDTEDVKLRAHAIKGGSGNVGAMRLSEAASALEKKASQGDLPCGEVLFERVRAEFLRYESFVSRPDWMDIARQQSDAHVEPCRDRV